MEKILGIHCGGHMVHSRDYGWCGQPGEYKKNQAMPIQDLKFDRSCYTTMRRGRLQRPMKEN